MRASLVVLAAMVTVAYSVGQYYVPRSYYTIDSDGHETAPVPLRRLRRSLGPVGPMVPYDSDANANANARADANADGGGSATANANANARANSRGRGFGDYQIPAYINSQPSYGSSGPSYGSSGPNVLRAQ